MHCFSVTFVVTGNHVFRLAVVRVINLNGVEIANRAGEPDYMHRFPPLAGLRQNI